MNLAFNPYVSQYVPAPIAEFQQAASHFQNEYDENLLASEKFKTMANSVKVLPGDKARLAMQLKKYEDGLGELAKAGNWEDAGLKVRNLATDFAGNYQSGEIGQLASTYRNYELYNAEKQKLGNEYAAWNDDFLRYQRSGNVNADGSYRGYTFGGLGKQENHAKRADEVLGKLAEDGSLTSGFKLNADGITYSVGEHGSEGVGMRKLKSVANAKASIFNDTIEGKDYLKKMSYQLGRNLTAQEQHDLSADYLLRTGMNQLGIKSTDKDKVGFVPGWLFKAKQAAESNEMNATTSKLEATTNAERVEMADAVSNYKVNEKGEVVQVSGVSKQVPAFSSYGGGAEGLFNQTEAVEKPLDPSDAVGAHVQGIIKDLVANQGYSGKRPRSPQQLWENYQSALKNTGAVFPRYAEWSPQMQKEKTKQLLPTGDVRSLLSGRKVALVGVDGAGKVVSPNELPDELKDMIADGRAVATVKARSKTNPYGMPGGYIVDIVKKDKQGSTSGKPYQLVVQASEEEEGAFGKLGELAHAKYSGSPRVDIPLGVDKNGDRRYYRVLNIPTAKNTFDQVVEMRVTHSNGMDAKVGEQSMDSVEDELYKRSEGKLKPYRLTSSGQANHKGEEKDYNSGDDESTEAE